MMRGLGLVCLLCLLASGGPVRADDDDGGGQPGASAGEGGGGADRSGASPSGAPPSGRPLQDLRGFLGLGAPPAPARPPSAAARPPAPPASGQLAAEPRELAVFGLDAPARARLEAAGFTVLEEAPAGLLPGTIARLRMPNGVPPGTARDQARALAPAARVDLNHLYRPGQAASRAASEAWPETVAGPEPGCAIPPVGMIDTGIDTGSPALSGRVVEVATRRGAGRAPSSPTHGTAVAALLAGRLGNTPILAVDAFHRRPDGDAADAFDIAAALALLAQRGVRVVNLSFAGPANDVLAVATERGAVLGMLLAAAIGNEGPASPPRYPAAYPWVVAVTGRHTSKRC